MIQIYDVKKLILTKLQTFEKRHVLCFSVSELHFDATSNYYAIFKAKLNKLNFQPLEVVCRLKIVGEVGEKYSYLRSNLEIFMFKHTSFPITVI